MERLTGRGIGELTDGRTDQGKEERTIKEGNNRLTDRLIDGRTD